MFDHRWIESMDGLTWEGHLARLSMFGCNVESNFIWFLQRFINQYHVVHYCNGSIYHERPATL